MKRFLINLLPNRIAWFFSRPYVAGDSMEKALNKVDSLYSENRRSTVDLLGEAVTQKEEVELMTKIYLSLIENIAEKRREYASISVKPTALGITISKEYCLENLRKILESAEKHQILVTMDMEDSSLTEVTLEMYKDLHKEFSTFGTVLQTRLFRTENDINKILPDNSRVRICIGIYLETADIALTDKRKMKEKIFEYTKLLFDKNVYVEIATHDEQTVNRVLSYIEENNIAPDRFEFQFLLGVPRKTIQEKILAKGYKVRLYTPFSTHWKYGTAYVKRRFLENPHMGLYVAKNLLQDRRMQFLILIIIIFSLILVIIIGNY